MTRGGKQTRRSVWRRYAPGVFFILLLGGGILYQAAQIIFMQKTLRNMTGEYAQLLRQHRLQAEIRDKLLLEYNALTAIPELYRKAGKRYGMRYVRPVQTVTIPAFHSSEQVSGGHDRQP